MTGLEYIDRLIEDINKTAATRTRIPDPFTQVKMVGLTGQADIKDFWSALNVWNADAHLDILTQFINVKDRLIDHNKGDKVDISTFQRDVANNRDAIAKVFQQFLDNRNLVDIVSGRPMAEFLVEQLDYIHQST